MARLARGPEGSDGVKYLSQAAVSPGGVRALGRLAGFVDRALGLWADAGFDAARGLYAERLDFSGARDAQAPYRAMVQARQIYVFADAARRGGPASYGERALEVMQRVIGAYMAGDPARGSAFSLGPGGEIVSARRDAYTHAFLLFALAAVHRLAPEPRHLAAADALSGFLWRALGDPEQGGVFVDDASPRDAKAQNPHMHLLEAYLFLYEASGAERYLAQARALARLFAQRMFQADLDALPEHFSRDWRRREPGAFEPGHHFEWIWLLAKFDDAAGEDHADLRAKLWRKALAAGLDAQGRCFDEVAIPGDAPVRSVRLWPHGEGVKAALAMPDAPEAAATLAGMAGALDGFLDRPFAGGWIDRFDAQGRPAVDFVPASSLYHLYLARAEVAAAGL